MADSKQREIKFRAWDSWEKKFSVDEIHPEYSALILNYLSITLDGEILQHNEKGVINEGHSERFTFEQFTGLKDKNGKEIFEGDILKDIHTNHACYAKVVYQKDAGFGGFSIEGPYWNGDEEPIETEVIGNIHENLQLLEGSND